MINYTFSWSEINVQADHTIQLMVNDIESMPRNMSSP